MGAAAEKSVEAGSTKQKAATPRRTAAVPPSQTGRVRALATYGMTCAQVAELYGVPVGEIERIVGGPASGKSR